MKITRRDIFIGNSKTENALLFVENLDKLVKTKSAEPLSSTLIAKNLEALSNTSESMPTGASSIKQIGITRQITEKSLSALNGKLI